MPIFLPIVLIVAGFFLLIKGADWLVDGASTFAKRLGISNLVIGLTVVSFGTSAPELIVNIFASLRGSAEIAIGNIIGSNISNTLLILGLTAAIIPLRVQKSTVFKEIPFYLLATLILFIMANDMLIDQYSISELGRGDGFAFLGFFIIFLYYTFGIRKQGNQKEEKDAVDNVEKPASPSIWIPSGKIIGGLIGLSIGGELTVRGAIDIAELMGLSEAFIGLTIVALGTSLPELTASLIAAFKKMPDIAVGNIIGSNIFNIFWILGLSSIIRPLPFHPEINFDLLVVIASTLALFVFIHTGKLPRRILFWRQREGHMISRWEGIAMLTSYFAYIGYISLRG